MATRTDPSHEPQSARAIARAALRSVLVQLETAEIHQTPGSVKRGLLPSLRSKG